MTYKSKKLLLSEEFIIVVAVCHPDDEALWIGGLICALSKYKQIKVNVICLSGNDDNSPRKREFYNAKGIAGYHSGLVLGGKLRSANVPLEQVTSKLEDGLRALNIIDISLLITHSPYGEEHMHPHHRQVSHELYKWAKIKKVPFSYFSCLALPNTRHQSMLNNMKRSSNLQVINFSKCYVPIFKKIFFYISGNSILLPKYYIQFLTDMNIKAQMLASYKSIDLIMHAQGYAMFTNNCESLYILDKKGLRPFQYVMQQMEVPGPSDLFISTFGYKALIRKAAKKILLKNK